MVFAMTAGFFVLIYFGYAGVALALTRHALPRLGIGAPVDRRELRPGQIAKEIRRSLVSIGIFGLLTVGQVAALRAGWISLAWDAKPQAIAIQLVALFLWNEIHFYLCHWLLHTRWLFRHVHRIHHESIVPTPFSTYSFHWVEAAMLGSVLFVATLVYDFHPLALGSLPLLSLLLNTIGHWNYDVFAGRRRSASVEHSLHHRLVQGNYGFYLPILDRWFSTKLQKR
jgi:sterol desaturase/sphingolipid hydroxylase (fatty acid hydroxylase superfamily)